MRLFARLRELAGRAELEVDLPAGARVADLRQAVAAAAPALGNLLARSAVAVDGEFAGDEDVLPDAGGEVALLPPVSGGSSGVSGW